MKPVRHFASDNYAGITPEAWAALQEANQNHEPAYGNDRWTQRAADRIREVFETPCEVFFVFNGTAANSLALAHSTQSYHSVLCHEVAHMERDECGAPEFFGNGSKLLLLPGANGKLHPAGIDEAVRRRTDVHYPKPQAVTVTQSTEVGTLYTPAELRAIGAMAKKHGLRFHMDGARFANAVAALGVAPREITWQAGVDVLCFGGTKNGIHVGEAVVFFNLDLAREFDFRAKQGGQLCSKMRFVSAPWVGMLQDGHWLRHAAHANRMARLLHDLVAPVPGAQILFPVEANAVFVDLPKPAIQALWDRGWMFYNFIGEGGCRLMCSWDTTEEDVRAFAADLQSVLSA
ncbi:MAG: threonine aldolase family protein [Verrucomicrobiota bacterium]